MHPVTAPRPDAALSAARTLDLECEGLQALRASLDQDLKQPFRAAVAMLAAARGRVIVTGIGKSGHVGQKIAATFASTGTPAFFVHPSEASHGDLGMITRDDAIVAISWSGESVELGNILTYSRRFKVPLIAITSRANSALAKQSDVVLELPRAKEACPHGLAPTTSTTMQLAHRRLPGDRACWRPRASPRTTSGCSTRAARSARSLKFVADMMHTGDRLPLVREGKAMTEALVTMTQKTLGLPRRRRCQGRLVGMITDGDLRRHMGPDLLTARVQDIMTRKPKTLAPGMLASAALELINSLAHHALFVVEKGKPVGIVHVHDLLRAGRGLTLQMPSRIPGPRRGHCLRPFVLGGCNCLSRCSRLGSVGLDDRLRLGLRLRCRLVDVGSKAMFRKPKVQLRLLAGLSGNGRVGHGLAVPQMGLVVSADRQRPECRADAYEQQRQQ